LKSNLKKYIYILIFNFLFVACGADSDFLRDVTGDETALNSLSTPEGDIFEQLVSGIYQYEMINDYQLGFTFMSVDSNCNSETCSLFKQQYTFFDNNISTYDNKKSQVVLSTNGWLDMSSEDECNVKFTNTLAKINCEDGKEEHINIEEESIVGQSILGVFSEISSEKVKDTLATFNNNSTMNTLSSTILNDTNSTAKYIINIDESPRIYLNSEYTIVADSPVLESYSNLYMKLNGYDIIVKNLNLDTSSIEIYLEEVRVNDFGSAPIWRKQIVYDNYTIVSMSFNSELKKLLKIKDEAFISFYNGFLRYGEFIHNTKKDSIYVNKDAFNSIYNQLKEEYIGTSKLSSYLEIDKGLHVVNYFFGKKASLAMTSNYDETKVNFTYDIFDGSSTGVNWIIGKYGLRRESSTCDLNLFINSFEYKCDDGRESLLSLQNTKALHEDFLLEYLQNNSIDIALENNSSLFSFGSSQVSLLEKNLVDAYQFNLINSLNVGTDKNLNDAVSLFSTSLYVNGLDADHYMVIESPVKTSNGIIKIYDNSDTEIFSSTWISSLVNGKEIINVEVPSGAESWFGDIENIILTQLETEPGKYKIITGTMIMIKNKETIVDYLDYPAKEDIKGKIL